MIDRKMLDIGPEATVPQAIEVAMMNIADPEDSLRTWVYERQKTHGADFGVSDTWGSVNSAQMMLARAGGNDLFANDSALRFVLTYLDEHDPTGDLGALVRSAVSVNARRRQISYEPYPIEPKSLVDRPLEWLEVPLWPAEDDRTTEALNNWRTLAQHGNTWLYDRAKATFLHYQKSPLHKPILSRFAASYAAVAIDFGDYCDAMEACEWHVEYVREFVKRYDEVPPNSWWDSLRIKRIKNSAETYQRFDASYQDIRNKFVGAIRETNEVSDKSLKRHQKLQLLKDGWRCFVRHLVNYRFRTLLDPDLPSIPLADRQAAVQSFQQALDDATVGYVELSILDWDTLSRASAVLLGDFDNSQVYSAKAKALTEVTVRRIHGIVPEPFLYTMWDGISKAMLGLAEAQYAPNQQVKLGGIEACDKSLRDLLIQIHSIRMTHSRNYHMMLKHARDITELSKRNSWLNEDENQN